MMRRFAKIATAPSKAMSMRLPEACSMGSHMPEGCTVARHASNSRP